MEISGGVDSHQLQSFSGLFRLLASNPPKSKNARRQQEILLIDFAFPHGYSICLVFLKPFERIYAPLAAGLLIKADTKLPRQKRPQLDRLYQRVVDDLDELVRAVGFKAA